MTSKTLYSVSMSLDGFIAGRGGDMSWLSAFAGPEHDPTVDVLIRETGSLLVGHRTFTGDDPNKGGEGEGEAFGGGWDGPQFVLTHRTYVEDVPGITFVDDLGRALDLARAAAGGRYVSVLGADIARQLIARGQLDEVLTFIVPIMLGDGVRLFDAPGSPPVRLERTQVTDAPMSTNLWFRVVR